jgi:hypothetical protein
VTEVAYDEASTAPGAAMKRKPRVLLYIEPDRQYYARYEERTRTHRFLNDPGSTVEPYWLEMLRVAPETWDPPASAEGNAA